MENPDHKERLDLQKIPCIRKVINTALVTKTKFDQRRVGAEVSKPTILAHYGMSFDSIDGLPCNHKHLHCSPRISGSEMGARQPPTSGREHPRHLLSTRPSSTNKVIGEAMLNAEGERIAQLRQGSTSG